MIEWQIAKRGIDNPAILDAFRAIPRELFVNEELRGHAYEDRALPIDAGQTISQPYIVALMMAAADVGPESRVLEVGSGSGYAAALLGTVAKEVVAIERIEALAEEARARIASLGIDNVDIHVGDGSVGWPQRAPFDAIIVSATASEVPPALIDQLADGGRLVIPVGGPAMTEKLLRIERNGDQVESEALTNVRFVPLIRD